MKAQLTLLWTHFDAAASAANESLPTRGMSATRPNSTIRPLTASRTNEPARSQWPKRSMAVKRRIVSPLRPPSMRMVPRTSRNNARAATVPTSR